MAGFAGVAAVGLSLRRLLERAFAPAAGGISPVEGEAVPVTVTRSEDLDRHKAGHLPRPGLTALLYRVDFDRTLRAGWSARGSADGVGYLPLDLHYLLTAWAEDAEAEHRILGRTLQTLETTGMLTGAQLDASGGWAPDEGVQLVLEELSTDDLMRIFDALGVDFRLSLPYLARVVVVAGTDPVPPPRVSRVEVGA